MSRCRPLEEYAEFIRRVRDNKNTGMGDKAAVEAAVDSCIEDGILVDILRKERARVRNILISALTEEEITRLREYEREMDKKEAWDGGRAECRAEDFAAIAALSEKMKADGRTDELVSALGDRSHLERLFIEYGIADAIMDPEE